ncbi:YkgJ family cysteine cluster protein [Candidatus Margulisiibacteriota bacterium]
MSNPEISFNCKQCGHCCNREGLVFLTTEDLHNLMEFFAMDYESFKQKYLSTFQRRLILKEHSEGGCIFAHTANHKCPVYEVRPEQCRTYPFWPEAKMNKDWYKNESRECPGIQGPGNE